MDIKHNWMYQNSSIMELQHIEWVLHRTDEFRYSIKNINSPESTDRIYIKEDPTLKLSTIFILNKGSIKWQSSEVNGNLELSLYSLISSKLSKYTGILKVDFSNNFIVGLRPICEEYEMRSIPIDLLIKYGQVK